MEKNPHTNWRYAKVAYILTAVCALAFVWLTYRSLDDAGSSSVASAIRFTIIIPEIVIWAIAVMSAIRFKHYADSIKDSPDGKAMDYIANALLLLVLYIILLTTMGSVTKLFAHSTYIKPVVFLHNHLPVAAALGSVAFLYLGSRRLNSLIRANMWTPRRISLITVPAVLLFIFFAWEFYRSVPGLESVNGIPRFALPVIALLFTYVLPHIVLWYVGLLACINLAHYAANTPGKLYKSLFFDLYRGILMVYICIFIAQLIIISSVDTTGFNPLLLVIYAILILSTVGYLLVFRGAKQLHKIEHAG